MMGSEEKPTKDSYVRANTRDVFETLDTRKEDARQPFQLFSRKWG